jgi:hypothetical protein
MPETVTTSTSLEATSHMATQSPSDPIRNDETDDSTGISNRESAADERAERAAHPPVSGDSPAPEDAAGHVGDEPIRDYSGLQTAHKAGSRSIAQKEDAARYPDRSMPASRKVPGAFGKEPSAAEPGEPE